MSAVAAILLMEADVGADFSRRLTFKRNGAVQDLTGWSARMKVKTDYGGTTVETLVSGAAITLGGVAGTIDLAIADTALEAWTGGTVVSGVKPGKKYVYDLELIDGSAVVRRIIQGDFLAYDQVSTT